MADIKRLLNKKGWTGRELGILEITNMAVNFRQRIAGEDPKPLIEKEQFQRMINNLTDREQGRIYNGYLSIHEWITLYYNIAQGNLQQAQVRYRTILNYITDAMNAEEVYRYIASLPAIMTEKQYKAARQQGLDKWLYAEDGLPQCDTAFQLIDRAIIYYAKLLTEDPQKHNPLKQIRKKYINEPIQSQLIRSRYPKAAGYGYYELADGRRSDRMSKEEWQAALTECRQPSLEEKLKTDRSFNEALDSMTSKEYGQFRFIKKAKLVYKGMEDEEAEEALDDEQGSPAATWHYYDEAPEDLTKWEVLEDEDLFLQLYDFGDTATEDAKDFVAEFKEAVDAIIADIDSRYFHGKTDLDSQPFTDVENQLFANEVGLAGIPVEEWETTLFSWVDLYRLDVYGFRADTEDGFTIWKHNWRAAMNGIAILQPPAWTDKPRNIDEDGNYIPPAPTTLKGLERFFPEAEDYADDVEEIESGREILLDSYYFVKAFNKALDIIAAYFDVPDITVFKLDAEALEDRIEALNNLVPMLYSQIKETDYEDKDLQRKKLQVLQDVFPEIDYKALEIPEEDIEEAKKLFDGFRAFKENGFADALFYRKHKADEGSEDE